MPKHLFCHPLVLCGYQPSQVTKALIARRRFPQLSFPRWLAYAAGLCIAMCFSGCKSNSDSSAKTPSLQEDVTKVQLNNQIPGVVFLAMVDGQPKVAAAGTLAVDSTAKLIPADPIALGSNGKAITASLIARLVEQDKLHWNDKLMDLMPSFEESMDLSYQTLTLEQLLRHQSGLAPLTEIAEVAQAVDAIGGLSGEPVADQEALIRWALATPAHFTPGSQTEYSNVNYVIAGKIAELVTGDSYENLVRAQVFIPLGIDGEISPPKMGVKGHIWQNGQWQVKNLSPEEEYLSQLDLAAGEWYMTMPDYGQFLKANIDGLKGHSTWLKQTTLAYMHSIKHNGDMGIGWQVLSDNGQTFSQHLGSDGESYQHGVIFSQQTGKGAAYFISGYNPTAIRAASSLALKYLQ
jgi:CubicO group peptidase (beta-lactamase class C family)